MSGGANPSRPTNERMAGIGRRGSLKNSWLKNRESSNLSMLTRKGSMKVYIIVPKTVDSKPPLTLSCGFAMAQIAHASMKAGHSFEHSVIILEVSGSKELKETRTKLLQSGVWVESYWEDSDLFTGKVLTAIVVDPVDTTPDVLKDLKLWSCNCNTNASVV